MTAEYEPSPGLWVSRSRIALKVVLKHLLAPIGLIVRPRPGLRVLFYHRVNTYEFGTLGLVSREISVPTSSFEWQMTHLAKHGYRCISLEEARAMLAGTVPFDPKAVLLTFDDGYVDNLTDAMPVLARHGFTATVFPVLGKLGADNSCWPMSDAKGLGDFMTEAQLRDWIAAGHDIGSHTVTHPVLTHVDDVQLADELAASRAGFEAMFARPCRSLAYPSGDVDARVAVAARAAGYDLAFTTRSGLNPVGCDTALLNRTEVSASDSRLIFALKMRGVFDWLGVRDTVFYRKVMRVLHRAASTAAGSPKAQAS